MDNFRGKVAFITGAASGIGLGIAQACVRAGMKVAMCDLRRSPLESAAASLATGGAVVVPVLLDVSDRSAWSACADRVRNELGEVDLLCSNAGVNFVGPTQEATYADWDFALGVNLGGAINAVSTFAPGMSRSGRGGHIVITSSVSGLTAAPGPACTSLRSLRWLDWPSPCVQTCVVVESGCRCCVPDRYSRSCSKAPGRCARHILRPRDPGPLCLPGPIAPRRPFSARRRPAPKSVSWFSRVSGATICTFSRIRRCDRYSKRAPRLCYRRCRPRRPARNGLLRRSVSWIPLYTISLQGPAGPENAGQPAPAGSHLPQLGALRQHPASQKSGRTMRSQLSKPMVMRTKLRPPLRRGGLLPRPELVARLCDNRRYRLATVEAAAGFGKTSLLSQCYEQTHVGQPTAWLSLDAADNDYPRFLAHLLAAIESSGVLPGKQFRHILRYGARLAPGTCADLLTSALDTQNCRLAICIDDFHLLDDSAALHLLSQLLLAPRSSLSWILASRAALTSLPLSRLRLLNEIIEIDTQALRFSSAESHEFLCGAVGELLEPALSQLLAERTEGWVAGLQLASLGLRAVANRGELIHGFTGANRNVADFLRETVLSNLDERTHEFLLATAILPRLSVDLCNCVTGNGDARQRLDVLETLNLFIFSLDDERRWYRYHHLFAEFLEQRLLDREPQRARRLQERASVWFEEAGYAVEAIELALRAQAFDRAARLLDELGLFDKGQAGALEHLAQRIPKEVLEQYPNLELERIYGWEADWNFTRSRSSLNRLKRVLEEWRSGQRPVPRHVDIDYIAAKIAHREMMVLFVSDDMSGTRLACEAWLGARHCADAHLEISTAGALLAARREHYDCVDIEAAAAALHDQYQRAQWTFGQIFQDCISGLAFAQMGQITRAREIYERALEAAVSLHGKLSPLASMPALLLAETHYEQNNCAAARTLIEDYMEVCHGLGYVDKLIAAYVTKARLEASDGQYRMAQRTLDEGDRCARSTGFPRLQAHILCERMRQLLANGNTVVVVDLARVSGLLGSCSTLQPHGRVTTITECAAISWSYAARANGDFDGAIRLLKNWYRFVTERQCQRSGLRLGLELAALYYQREDIGTARHYVCEALRMAASHGLVRSFIDAGREIHQVLREAVAGGLMDGELLDHARLVLGQVTDANGIRPAQAAAGSIRLEEFTHREVDILQLAAGDVPNREIARRLVLSEHTVKWYWKQIFSKLNVHRRLQAVITARAAGLIH